MDPNMNSSFCHFDIHYFIVQADLVIYEMNVRAFTADESSGLDGDIRGSYLGVIDKVGSLWFGVSCGVKCLPLIVCKITVS